MKTETAPDGREDSIVAECELPERPEKVWRALTTPELIADWLLPTDLPSDARPEAGRRFTLTGKPDEGGTIACEVLEAEPPRLLRYGWRSVGSERHDAVPETVVTFLLTETRTGGTHLRIVHRGAELALSRTIASLSGVGLHARGRHLRGSARPRDRSGTLRRARPFLHPVRRKAA